MNTPLSLFVLAFFLCSDVLFAADVFRFRGENSQGKFAETELLKSWPETGLTPKWINSEIGAGWSGVIKIKDRLYLNCVDSVDTKKESVVCLDLDGKKIWQQPIGAVWGNSFPVSRGTPTYVPGKKGTDGYLLVLSGAGEISCLSASTGQVFWQKELSQTYETHFDDWGVAESLAVRGDTVFVAVCGKKTLAVALKISEGTVLWETPSNGNKCAYVSPVVHEKQLIFLTMESIVGIDVENGKLNWQESILDATGPAEERVTSCNSPLLKGNQLFISSGNNQGCAMFDILPEGKGIAKRWSSKVLDTHHGGVVELNGRIYGSNWINNNVGNWICLDWDTGKTIYDTPWDKLGKGIIFSADGMLYLYEEKRGTVGLVQPGDALEVVGRFQVDFGTRAHWSHPTISDGVLYVRRGNSVAAFDLRANRAVDSK